MSQCLPNHRLHLDGSEKDSARHQARHPEERKDFDPRVDSIAINLLKKVYIQRKTEQIQSKRYVHFQQRIQEIFSLMTK